MPTNNNKPQITPTARRNEVFKRKMSGQTKQQIWEWYHPTYQKTLHSFEKDITWCNRKLQQFVDAEGKDVIIDHLIKYDTNYKIALEYGQISAANQALQNKEKLLGLHRPENSTFVQNNSYNFDNLSLEEAKQLLIEFKKEKDD